MLLRTRSCQLLLCIYVCNLTNVKLMVFGENKPSTLINDTR